MVRTFLFKEREFSRDSCDDAIEGNVEDTLDKLAKLEEEDKRERSRSEEDDTRGAKQQ